MGQSFRKLPLCSLLSFTDPFGRFKTMRKKFAYALTGLSILGSALGCCCSHANRCNPCGGMGYGAGFAPAASPCGPGGCQPGYGPMGMTGGYDNTAYALPAGTMAAAPTSGYPMTASLPLNSLPTHH